MSLTRPIPKAAMPVVEVLRRDVPRPINLPMPHFHQTTEFYLRWGGHCPMGLHLKSTDATPAKRKQFAAGCCPAKSVESFGEWWDLQDNAQAAMDAVWPRKDAP